MHSECTNKSEAVEGFRGVQDKFFTPSLKQLSNGLYDYKLLFYFNAVQKFGIDANTSSMIHIKNVTTLVLVAGEQPVDPIELSMNPRSVAG